MKQTLQGYLKGKTIILPTHAIKFAAMIDELVIMDRGRIIRKGSYRDLAETSELQRLFMEEKKKADKNEEN